ncbi:MAG TPA: hypothetical protein PLF25_05465 [Accumulibacter sp.]|nr:hypothetical protein [Accumulibacter sp.]
MNAIRVELLHVQGDFLENGFEARHAADGHAQPTTNLPLDLIVDGQAAVDLAGRTRIVPDDCSRMIA